MCCCIGGNSEDMDEGPVLHPPQRDESQGGGGPNPPPGQLNDKEEGQDPKSNFSGEGGGGGGQSGGGGGGGGSSRPAFPFLVPGGLDDSLGKKRRVRRLYCDTGFDVAVFPNGKVAGTKSPRNKFGNLEFESAGFNGEIRIKGVSTGFYITMTPQGRVMAQPLATNMGTVWVETRIGGGVSYAYMSLLSLDYAHRGYYLAIKKSGKPKAGRKTNHPYPQRAISFLPRFVEE